MQEAIRDKSKSFPVLFLKKKKERKKKKKKKREKRNGAGKQVANSTICA